MDENKTEEKDSKIPEVSANPDTESDNTEQVPSETTEQKSDNTEPETDLTPPDPNAPNPHIQIDETDEEPVELPNESKSSAIEQLADMYKVAANEIKLRFRNDAESANQVASFFLKILNGKGENAKKWNDKMSSKMGENKAYIQNKIIPTLVNAYNAKSENPIELPKQVNDEKTSELTDRNGKKVGNIVIPEGFNQAPVDLGDESVSIDGGYPAINFSSQLIRSILGAGDDKKYLKKLLGVLVKKVEGSKAAKALLTHNIFTTQKSGIYKVIQNAATAKGIPMLHRPLKVMAEELVGDAQYVNIDVTPINSIGRDNKTEAVYAIDMDPMFEGLKDYLPKFNIDTKSAVKYGKTVSVPKAFLSQYYEILTPSGSNGLSKYGKFISKEDRDAMLGQLGEKETERITSENKNINDTVLTEYLKSTNGVPLFYILVPRKGKKERIMVCDDYVLNGQVCVKSIIGKSKIAYFFPEDLVDALFDAG